MRHHVEPEHDVRPLAFGHQPRGDVASEELDDGRNVLVVSGDRRNVRSRFDTEHRDACLLEILQQIAVVAGHLDDQALRTQLTLRNE